MSRADLDFDAWQDWQAEIARRLNASIAFFYGNFVRGVRRAVIDGIEPVDRPSDSIQLELFEYIYHQILRKDPEWVARDLFRAALPRATPRRRPAPSTTRAGSAACCCARRTRRRSRALIERPLDEGDLLANANTVIYLGKIRDGHGSAAPCTSPSTAAAPAPTRSSPTGSTTAGYGWSRTSTAVSHSTS